MARCRILVVVLAFAVFVAACGGSESDANGGDPDDRTPTPEAADELTTVDELLAEVGPDGHLPLEPSLQLLALTYGGLPGVDTPSDPTGDLGDGTLALRAVANHWNELTADQQAGVRDAYALPADWTPATRAAVGAGPGNGAPRPAVDEPGVEAYRAAIDRSLPLLVRRLGPLLTPVVVENGTGDTDTNALDPTVRADTALTNGACRIRVFPSRVTAATTGPDPTLTHELFHCFQMEWDSEWATEPQWLAEGSAVWVSQAIMAEAGGEVSSPQAVGWFRQYYRSEGLPTFERVRDAAGWFAHASAQGINLWGMLRGMLVAGNQGAWDLVAAQGGAGWLASWPSSFMRTDWGPEWRDSWPGIPSGAETRTSPVYIPVGNGVTESVASESFAARHGAVRLDAEITTISGFDTTVGYVHLDGATRPVAEVRGQWCTGTECTCPPDTRRAGTTFPPLPHGNMAIAITGGLAAGSFSVQGQSLRDVCEEELQCPVGTWIMNAPPVGTPLEFESGGLGTKLTVTPDGVATFDYASFQPIVARVRDDGAIYRAAIGGIMTGRVDLVPNTPFTSAPILDVNASGLTGDGSVTVGGGIVFTLDTADLQELAAIAPEYGPSTMNCVADDELTITGGGITHFYKPWV